MYKGTYNENGEYTGFYVEGIHENIPQPNIELTDEEWQQALSKNYKVIEGKHTYMPFVPNEKELLESIRSTRNHLLTESDWTQATDAPFSETTKLEWRTYRQTLRDITNDTTNISWPDKPL